MERTAGLSGGGVVRTALSDGKDVLPGTKGHLIRQMRNASQAAVLFWFCFAAMAAQSQPSAAPDDHGARGVVLAADDPQPGNSGGAQRAGGQSSGYVSPTRQKTLRDFLMDTVGPYPNTMAIFTAAIHQATDSPPEWRQGAAGLSRRFGSNMGITAVGNATRFGLGEVLNEDTSFYRCRCRRVPQRLTHAALSALIARRRSDGSHVFSIPGLAAPYAATMTAIYAWYPARYGAKDAFRMGNYNLLGTVGSDIAFEFIPSKVWNFLGRFHLNSSRVANEP